MKTTHILDHLTEKERTSLWKSSIEKTWERQELIFQKMDEPRYLYVLLQGQICVCDESEDGNRNILTIISEKEDCFGEVYLFMDMPYPFYAEAMKKSKVLMIPREVLREYGQISQNLNVMLSQKAYTLSQKLKLLMKDSLREKILEYIQQHGDVVLKRHEMASYLGVSRPALSKELYRMVDDGLLVIDENGDFQTVI